MLIFFVAMTRLKGGPSSTLSRRPATYSTLRAQAMTSQSFGAGCIGGATAWHLREADPGLSVAAVAPDASYQHAATSLASGEVRQLFGQPENVQVMQYTHRAIDEWEQWSVMRELSVTDLASPLGWRPNGSLFITGRSSPHTHRLETIYELLRKHGVEALGWSQRRLVGDIRVSTPTTLGRASFLRATVGWTRKLMGNASRAAHLGAVFVTEKVFVFEVRKGRVVALRLRSGKQPHRTSVLNAAGMGVGTVRSAQARHTGRAEASF